MTPEGKFIAEAYNTLYARGDKPIPPNSGLKLLDTDWLNSYPAHFMNEVEKFLQLGWHVVFINTVNNESHAVFIPAGTTFNRNIEFFGPDYMSTQFIDITNALENQRKPSIKDVTDVLRDLGYGIIHTVDSN